MGLVLLQKDPPKHSYPLSVIWGYKDKKAACNQEYIPLQKRAIISTLISDS
jgi:hypothetical protein